MKTASIVIELCIYALVMLSVGALLWDMKKGGRN